jgi:hypothetical protein
MNSVWVQIVASVLASIAAVALSAYLTSRERAASRRPCVEVTEFALKLVSLAGTESELASEVRHWAQSEVSRMMWPEMVRKRMMLSTKRRWTQMLRFSPAMDPCGCSLWSFRFRKIAGYLCAAFAFWVVFDFCRRLPDLSSSQTSRMAFLPSGILSLVLYVFSAWGAGKFFRMAEVLSYGEAPPPEILDFSRGSSLVHRASVLLESGSDVHSAAASAK